MNTYKMDQTAKDKTLTLMGRTHGKSKNCLRFCFGSKNERTAMVERCAKETKSKWMEFIQRDYHAGDGNHKSEYDYLLTVK